MVFIVTFECNQSILPMKRITIILISLLSLLCSTQLLTAQHSVARDWNEALLNAIRKDYARPTVHARNLFHSSVLMYDAWAIFNSQAEPLFLGKTYHGYTCNFNGISTPSDVDAATHEIISYAMFRLMKHRFKNSPNAGTTSSALKVLFTSYGYDLSFTSTDYSTGSYAALGNYLAQQMIAFGLQDNSNEQNEYANKFYLPVNYPLVLELYEDNDNIDPNRWQPLAFDYFIDQAGNVIGEQTPAFLSPEWGEVSPFSLKDSDLDILNTNFNCYVYNDPGPPVYIDNSSSDGIDDPYKWHFALVASWSAHLDPSDPTMIDISPGALGNVDISEFPETFEDYKTFYNFTDGGDIGTGHDLNPVTGQPYTQQLVKRSDYARVLAEFWADGPDSETPPGHWFTILNYVNDHPMTVKKFGGSGPTLEALEWDVKSYLVLAGAMHDAAINTWGIKGYYDYIRPISAIRYMASKGQSTDPALPNFNPHGIPLIPGYIELIKAGDPLAGTNNENVDKIKIFAWKGPDYIVNPDTDIAGVDWILGTRWWPYQRGTFVTPPFAGYLSGHSTFSRAAAEVMTKITGDQFFPGGMGTFDITKNDFLVFEEGPSESLTLQWATYQDASDQTSLSRIWGGIHPPIDDIKGRLIGDKIGRASYNLALEYFTGTLDVAEVIKQHDTKVFPNPFQDEISISTSYEGSIKMAIYTIDGKQIINTALHSNLTPVNLEVSNLSPGVYFLKLISENNNELLVKKLIKN